MGFLFSPRGGGLGRFRAFALAPLFLCSCVTSADLRAVSDQLAAVEAVAQDGTKTDADLMAQIHFASDQIEAVAADVEDRTEGFIKGLTDGQTGGIAGILAALGVHIYRNSTRKRDLAKVQEDKSA